MAKLPRPTGKEMLRFLQQHGFALTGIRGSHHYLSRGHQRTTVPVHGNRNLKIGTLRKILRDIDMTSDEFEQLWNA